MVTFDGDHTYPTFLVPKSIETIVKEDLILSQQMRAQPSWEAHTPLFRSSSNEKS